MEYAESVDVNATVIVYGQTNVDDMVTLHNNTIWHYSETNIDK